MTSKKSAKANQGIKGAIPRKVAPMLCTLTREPVADPEYLFEIKWDGFRIISHVHKNQVQMNSRSGLDYTAKYPLIAKVLKNLGHDLVLDGEAVVFNEEGIPDFDALQLYNGHTTPIAYCVFDILWLDGYDLKEVPLIERKTILKEITAGSEILKYSESFDDGPGLYELMIQNNLEGIVAKKKNSAYRPGTRSYDWLKTPTRKRQEFVVGGWAESENGRAFRSLLFGAYEGKKLKWIGRSGGGYKQHEMPGILKQLKLLEIESSPFDNKVLDTKGAIIHWVKPQLVANFEFATWTRSGRIRKPATFLGFRKDKNAKDVVREVPAEEQKQTRSRITKKQRPASANSNWPEVERQSRSDSSELEIDDCRIELSGVDRMIWKDVSKAKLIEYYHHVAPFILPHVKSRPQSLHLKLHGATAPGLYIKDMEGREPECAEVFVDKRRHKAEGKRDRIDYLVCNNEATLLWMINLGCIDINPWSSRVEDPLHPDYLIIDLDPSEKELTSKSLGRLQAVALATKEYLEMKGLKAYAKTSGKTGIHFQVPCGGLDYSQARRLTEHICSDIHQLVPDDSTINNTVSQRGDKIYIDPSQNDYADTIAAPYSVRPYMVPTVSTPLEWREVNKKIDPRVFSMDTVLKRFEKKGDLFISLYDAKTRNSNNKILRKY